MEAALLLPLLLLIVFGVIDFGRMLNAQISVTEAAREAARASSIGMDQAGAEDAAQQVDASADISGSTFCPSTPGPNDDATVVATHQFEFVTPVGALAEMFGGSGFGTLTLTGHGVMPCRG
ncbi:MAG TPA: TadE/TadG family type IV pilus assembly protein [Micromonosporaceae bacterium]